MKYHPKYSLQIQDLYCLYEDKSAPEGDTKRFGPKTGQVVAFKGYQELNDGFEATVFYTINTNDEVLVNKFNGDIFSFMEHLVRHRPSIVLKMEAPTKNVYKGALVDLEAMEHNITFFNYLEGIATSVTVFSVERSLGDISSYTLELRMASRTRVLSGAKQFNFYIQDDMAAETDSLAGTSGISFGEIVDSIFVDHGFERGTDYAFDMADGMVIDGQFVQPAELQNTPFGISLSGNYLMLGSSYPELRTHYRFRVQANELDKDFLNRLCEREGVALVEELVEYRVASPKEVIGIPHPHLHRAKSDRGSYVLTMHAYATGRSSHHTYLEQHGIEVEKKMLAEFSSSGSSDVVDFYPISFPVHEFHHFVESEAEPTMEERRECERKWLEKMGGAMDDDGGRVSYGTLVYRTRLKISDLSNPEGGMISPTFSTEQTVAGTTLKNYTVYFPMEYDPLLDDVSGDIRSLWGELRTAESVLPRSVTVANYSDYSDHAGITGDFAPLLGNAFMYLNTTGGLSRYVVSPQAPVGSYYGTISNLPTPLQNARQYGSGNAYYYGEMLPTAQDARRMAVRRMEMHLTQARKAEVDGSVMDARAGSFGYVVNKRYHPSQQYGVDELEPHYITRVEFAGYSPTVNGSAGEREEILDIIGLKNDAFFRGHYEMLRLTDNVVYRPRLKTPQPQRLGRMLAEVASRSSDAATRELFATELEGKSVIASNSRIYSPIDRFGRIPVEFIAGKKPARLRSRGRRNSIATPS